MAATNYSTHSNSNKNNNSRFKIAGGTSGMKVSWQVTGIRKDPWANANRIQVEEDKPDKERGYYIHPDLYGQPAEKGISRLLFPEEEQELLINENKRRPRKKNTVLTQQAKKEDLQVIKKAASRILPVMNSYFSSLCIVLAILFQIS